MLGKLIKNSNVIAIKDSSKDLSLLGSFIEDYGDTRNTVKVYNYKLKNNLDYSNLSKNLYQFY